jgi:hypothetical protein
VLKSYNDLLEKHLQPTGQEVTEGISDALLALVKDNEFLVQVEGLDLTDQDTIELGGIRIQRSDRRLLEKVKFGGSLDLDSIYEQFKDNLWLIGAIKGSPDVASEQFEYRAALTIGLVAICGAVLYKGAMWRSRVRAMISPLEHRKATLILRRDRGGDNPELTRRWGHEQGPSLDAKSLTYLTDHCFLKQLAGVPGRADRTELEEAIVRSIYWFADAYRDINLTMRFIKLWSCAECFFAIDKEGVTELNAKGFTAILAFAGFNIIGPKDYPEVKRRVKNLYALRSDAIHRGSFGHIQFADLDDLSRWIAWIIVSMVSLSERGYRTLRQVREQSSRLDQPAYKGVSQAK